MVKGFIKNISKGLLQEVKSELKSEGKNVIKEVKSELKSEGKNVIQEAKSELKSEGKNIIQEAKSELKSEGKNIISDTISNINGDINIKDISGGEVPKLDTEYSECNILSDIIDDGSICMKNNDIVRIVELAKKFGVVSDIDTERLKTLSDKSLASIKTKQNILTELKIKVEPKCDSESCVVENIANRVAPEVQTEIKDIIDETYNIKGPWNSTEWLNDKQIDGTLSKLTKKYDGFHTISFKMRDQFVGINMNPMDLYNNDIRRIGFIANEDVSTGGGTHWVAIYIDMTTDGTYDNPFTIEFFNSGGGKIYPEILEWFYKIQHTINTTPRNGGTDNDITYHAKCVCVCKIQHQRKNSECGVYSLYYIWSRVSGTPYKMFELHRVADEQMIKFRKALFRHS